MSFLCDGLPKLSKCAKRVAIGGLQMSAVGGLGAFEGDRHSVSKAAAGGPESVGEFNREEQVPSVLIRSVGEYPLGRQMEGPERGADINFERVQL